MNRDDPVADLIPALAPLVPAAVDELHIAAVLESRGVTDAMARETYGYPDVFALAKSVSPRLAFAAAALDRPERKAPGALRTLAHGPLYALPCAVYPAVFVTLGAPAMLRGLVLATAVGWVAGMGMSVAAFQLLGQGRHRQAGRVLRLLGSAALLAGLGAAWLLAAVGPGGPEMVAFVVAQLGFQLGAAVLVFHGKELRLVALMLPACVAGVVYYAAGLPAELSRPTLLVGAASSVLVMAVAGYATVVRSAKPDPPRPAPLPRTLLATLPSVGYAAISAGFLLYTDARYLTAPFDVSIGVAPLVLGMGVLEWRSHRFAERADALMHTAGSPAAFRRDVWRVVLGELGLCMLVLVGLGTALLLVLAEFGSLSFEGALLIDAHLVLGGAYFIGFLLANHQRFRPLLVVTAAVLAVYVPLTILVAPRLAPYGEIPIFLGSATLLLLLLLTALRRGIGDVHRYR
ncbi:hypothetical protein [Actinophytocola sp.]|uniref:hypothetical protein n=1 Tax=Actinophytocola sp. TaxID=1872138 RepID=UPI002ED09D55